ncbi:HlyU family transcriptional regulator [Vibrio breoganii]|uniref:Transcriptional regulator n=1 Tax=Vibrio breoganii TaxID=553239 RepID=A0AAP8MZH3_9VIBR|nr:HlyU family transcriptional regulator [Vibrio breoganii]MDN3716069.1 HlyU family transcriptional regulator [Vibrio breoganii]OCH73852.1 transcriptional regulator [Vibrio breoganii]OEF88221.1 transcriptional regulator [Vibrio breoganii 1C10]PMF77894.1 transcriptional regulator [Vibrio breoganii]PMG08727.1 transcriptional regulator [Vibrio breoganii]
MGWFSRLFGSSEAPKQVAVEPIEYKGYLIYAEPIAEGGQYRIAGRITLGEGDSIKTHRFIRSDLLGNEGDANELMIKKAQMLIDQMGETIFNH